MQTIASTEDANKIPVADVARLFGVKMLSGGRARCWRHDDRRPSMTVDPRTNRMKCHVCDPKGITHSPINLVKMKLGLEVAAAAEWLHQRFPGRVRRVRTGSHRPASLGTWNPHVTFGSLYECGFIRVLKPSEVVLLGEFFKLHEKRNDDGRFETTYDYLSWITGLSKRSLITAVRSFESKGLLDVTRRKVKGEHAKNEPNTYRLRIGEYAFQQFLRSLYEKFSKEWKKEKDNPTTLGKDGCKFCTTDFSDWEQKQPENAET